MGFILSAHLIGDISCMNSNLLYGEIKKIIYKKKMETRRKPRDMKRKWNNPYKVNLLNNFVMI